MVLIKRRLLRFGIRTFRCFEVHGRVNIYYGSGDGSKLYDGVRWDDYIQSQSHTRAHSCISGLSRDIDIRVVTPLLAHRDAGGGDGELRYSKNLKSPRYEQLGLELEMLVWVVLDFGVSAGALWHVEGTFTTMASHWLERHKAKHLLYIIIRHVFKFNQRTRA
ncbi:hypothetical protein BDN72DRAFT_859709 [Pluteus cervinus]|uniref:Uncharacterized protein n=1 Tax=Pluteus cervinus TaxID=181527 RepID=A0ACD3AMW1_9AGAR|nr:hypothetical protein BDN72DRAFT_859709 [Pluteus cervinus]